ncbi:20113_t:CDS:2 [Rhizophagus irregularis]|nr:20113_t:CDS:2 [Rhizophagus irregularis]
MISQQAYDAAYKKLGGHVLQHPTRSLFRAVQENIKGIENPYEPLTTLPFQNAQPTIMQSYSQNDYIHSLLPISQSIQTPIDSSYVYPTNLPISFPYYSNSSVQLNNCPPTQNSYSFTPYLANANSYS